MDTLFSDSTVTVTKSIVKTSDGISYQIKQINSTHLTFEEPKRLGFGIAGFFAGIMVGFMISGATSTVPGLHYVTMLLPLPLGIFAAYKAYKMPKKKFYISLHTSSGELKAFYSFDKSWVNKVNDAILQAMSTAA